MRHGAAQIVGAWRLAILVSSVCTMTATAGVVLRVGDQKGGNQSLLQAAGELRGLNYEIEWSEFPAAAPLLEALNAGAIDVGYVGNAPFFFAYGTGVPARVISAVQQNSDGLAIVVPEKSPIRSARDLRGRRIGTGRGSIGHYLALATLERAGLRVDDVHLVFLGPIDARTALSTGAIDAWATWEPYTSMMEISEGSRRIADGNGIGGDKSFLVAGLPAIGQKRAALADFALRLNRARQWALQHTDQYAAAWAKVTGSPEAIAKRWFARAQIHGVAINDALVVEQQSIVDLYARAGVIRTRFRVSEAFDPSFYSRAVASTTRQ
jgi:sulfonate transport system substrate-binding protein